MAEIRLLDEDQLKQIYHEYMRGDFPPRELRPYRAMVSAIRDGKYAAYGYFDGDRLLGYSCCFLQPEKEYVFMDYFAVVPDLRDQGIGSAFLSELAEAVPAHKGFFIEAECVSGAKNEKERDQRERRIRFYVRNGARVTTVKCMLFFIDYNILFLPAGDSPVSDDSLFDAVVEFYRYIYGSRFSRLCRPYREEPAEGQ